MNRIVHLTASCITILLISSIILPSVSLAADDQGYTGRKVDIVLNDVDVRDALFFIGDAAGMNIVIDGDVSGRITLELRDVPWDQVLNVILFLSKLEAVFEDGVLSVRKVP